MMAQIGTRRYSPRRISRPVPYAVTTSEALQRRKNEALRSPIVPFRPDWNTVRIATERVTTIALKSTDAGVLAAPVVPK